MRKKQIILGILVLLLSLLMVSCGIPQEEHDAILAERDEAQNKVESLETDVESLQENVESLEDELDEVQEQIESIEDDRSELESDLASAQIQLSSLQSDLDNANDSLAAAAAQIAKMEAIYRILLLYDDFEGGSTEGWNLEGDWSVIQEGDNYILQGVGPCSAEAGSQEWADYTLEARIKYSQSANISVRITAEPGLYSLIAMPDGPSLYKHRVKQTLLAHSGVSFEENQWIDVKIDVEGNKIDVYMDNTLLFRYRDSDPLLSGNIGFELPENSVLYVDYVIVMAAR